MKPLLRFTVGIIAVSIALPAFAQATDSCEQRYNDLNERFSNAYITLGNECYPSEPTQDDAYNFEISPECIERYNTLGNEMNEAYTALSADCQEVLFPQPVEETPTPEPTEVVPEPPLPPVDTPITDPGSTPCDDRFIALSDKFAAAYIEIDAECYPQDGASWCGFELSAECQERYNTLATERDNAYNALYEECYGAGWFSPVEDSTPVGVSPENLRGGVKAISREVVAAPTKKEMLARIKSLKKQLRRAKATNKKMRSRCRK